MKRVLVIFATHCYGFKLDSGVQSMAQTAEALGIDKEDVMKAVRKIHYCEEKELFVWHDFDAILTQIQNPSNHATPALQERMIRIMSLKQEGVPVLKIAEMEGLSVATVYQYTSRAKRLQM